MAEKKEKELSFEDSLKNLEEIVKKLETGDVPLDEAITQFQTAMNLAKRCDEQLKKAEEAITKLVQENGDVVDFQVDE
jgi:exodeoxyribonuclease VII small subunit